MVATTAARAPNVSARHWVVISGVAGLGTACSIALAILSGPSTRSLFR